MLAQSVENTQVMKGLGEAGYELSHFHKRENAKNHKETSRNFLRGLHYVLAVLIFSHNNSHV